MKKHRGSIVLLVLAALVALLNVALVQNPAMRNVELMPEMVRSVPYDSFSENPNFPNTVTMQQPIEGTIQRGLIPLHYAATPEDAARAGEELVSPIAPDDAAAMARGKFVYESYCLVCHGAEGKGDGTVALRGFPTPPSYLAENAMNMKDGRMFHVVTYGQANMPSYASQVDRDDRWRVILYVRSLQATGTAPAPGSGPPGETTPAAPGDDAPGETVVAEPAAETGVSPESIEPGSAETAANVEGVR